MDIGGYGFVGQSTKLLPGPPLRLGNLAHYAEIPAIQRCMGRRPGRENRESPLKILAGGDATTELTLLAAALKRSRDEILAHRRLLVCLNPSGPPCRARCGWPPRVAGPHFLCREGSVP